MPPTISPAAAHPHRAARRGPRLLALGSALFLTCAVVVQQAGHAEPPAAGAVELPVDGGRVSVDPATLAVTARTDSGRTFQLSAPSPTDLGEPGATVRGRDQYRWTFPGKGLTVTARAERGRLRVTLSAARDQKVSWPVTGADRAASSLQWARGSGLDIPVGDRWWNSADGGLAGSETGMSEGLSLPLWGYRFGSGAGVSYLTPTDIGTSLKVTSQQGRLRTTASHTFDAGEGTRTYDTTFALTDGGAVAPAADYRSWLKEHGRLGSLREKIEKNPDSARLLGAFHAYAWGAARTPEAVGKLKRLGVNRLWLGYDADGKPMSRAAVRAAKDAGYLVGPYDTFSNGQDPKDADSPTAVWPGRVHPDFCVRDADGKPETGFGGRGCYLSSQAFEQAEREHGYLADRTRKMTANGADSYFLDVDATGELFRDHSPGHPMTKAGDRANRTDRMRRLAKDFVLGSETAQPWANRELAFDHGAATPVDDRLWKLQKDKEKWGAYYPKDAPKAFFKPVELPADVAKAMYDPAYRVPLYETALHGSLVNAERWELSYGKLPRQKTDRALLAMLYNNPLNYVLDGPSLDRDGRELATLQRYFEPLHKAAGTERLTSFERLTDDRRVQRTTFGDGTLTVTANFGSSSYRGLPGGCVDAELRGDSAPRRLCPGRQ
ncbi:glycoside hydrolase [Streptomyces monticola]|uniref:Glycoside hydrolase n=1 Tax=Streptomyces monticola TaxID=2666263 RepID=A0ABW2JAY7_9ACTN